MSPFSEPPIAMPAWIDVAVESPGLSSELPPNFALLNVAHGRNVNFSPPCAVCALMIEPMVPDPTLFGPKPVNES